MFRPPITEEQLSIDGEEAILSGDRRLAGYINEVRRLRAIIAMPRRVTVRWDRDI